MERPRICASITSSDIRAAREAEAFVDLYEVRIDLIGDDWQEVARSLSKPWIACNRSAREGGQWQGNEARRIEKLLQAMEMGAALIDLELRTRNLENVVKLIKRRTQLLLSYHDLAKTPASDTMMRIVEREIQAGADVCKVVTTAHSAEEGLRMLRLIEGSAGRRVVAFAMGPLGTLSRVLCPLVGGDFTYASLSAGSESAPGQMAACDLRNVYDLVVK